MRRAWGLPHRLARPTVMGLGLERRALEWSGTPEMVEEVGTPPPYTRVVPPPTPSPYPRNVVATQHVSAPIPDTGRG